MSGAPSVRTFDMKLEIVVIPVSDVDRARRFDGEHEKRTGEREANGADWYAAYIVREQAGEELPS